jgi:hypothetical protein
MNAGSAVKTSHGQFTSEHTMMRNELRIKNLAARLTAFPVPVTFPLPSSLRGGEPCGTRDRGIKHACVFF